LSSDDFEALGFFLLRTPLLPWSVAEEILAARGGTSDAANSVRVTLRRTLGRRDVHEAIRAASDTFGDRLREWLDEGIAAPDVELSALQYVLRLSSRSTPFGLFAGWSTGETAQRTAATLAGYEHYRCAIRLRIDYIAAVARAVARDILFSSDILLRGNTTLLDCHGEYRYTCADEDGWFVGAAAARSALLDAALTRAALGATGRELAESVRDAMPSIAHSDECQFVVDMYDNNIIWADLEPRVTGRPALNVFLDSPAATSSAHGIQQLRALAEVIAPAACVSSSLSEGVGRLGIAHGMLRGLETAGGTAPALDVDLVKPAVELTLGRNVLAEILRGVDCLHILNLRRAPRAITKFQGDFVRRFGEREVPLLLALDNDEGVGFGEPEAYLQPDSDLCTGVATARETGQVAEAMSPQHAELLARAAVTFARGQSELVLSSRVLELFARMRRNDRTATSNVMPASFSVVGVLGGASSEQVDRGNFQIFLQLVTGEPGLRLISRYCHADDKLCRAYLEAIGAHEQSREDAVVADVTFLPNGPRASVVSRPSAWSYEIPLLGACSVSPDRQIPLNDILVSARAGGIRLRSRRLDRTVLPYVGSPLDHGPLAYRFFWSFQFLYGGVPTWDWGPLSRLAALPRVSFGKAVLALRRWNICGDSLQRVCRSSRDVQLELLRQLLGEMNVPFIVGLDSDTGGPALPIDTRNPVCAELLLKRAKQASIVRLVEVFPESDALLAVGPEGRFRSDIVVPFVRRRPAPPRDGRYSHVVASTHTRGVATEWLYVKFYAGPLAIDRLLVTQISDVVELARRAYGLKLWHFVRFNDPDWHVRFRMQGDQSGLRDLLPHIFDIANDGLGSNGVYRCQVDTYDREVDRYGGTRGMEISEGVFSADSDAAIRLLDPTSLSVHGLRRWEMVILGIDSLFDDFDYSIEDRIRVLDNLRVRFHNEFRIDVAGRKAIGRRYRRESARLFRLLMKPPEFSSVFQVLASRSRAVRALVSDLKAICADVRAGRSLDELLRSFIHMHANRMFRSGARMQELVVYDFLCRHLEGKRRAPECWPRDGQ
jgi:thiopeptide-type bacteriocin biosynthesis protein